MFKDFKKKKRYRWFCGASRCASAPLLERRKAKIFFFFYPMDAKLKICPMPAFPSVGFTIPSSTSFCRRQAEEGPVLPLGHRQDSRLLLLVVLVSSASSRAERAGAFVICHCRKTLF